MLQQLQIRYNVTVRLFLAICLLAAVNIASGAPRGTEPLQRTASKKQQSVALTAKDIFSRCRGSVVRITTEEHRGDKPVIGSGSGFFFSRNDMIVTAYHVVSRAESIEIQDANGEKYVPKSIAYDSAADVALLYLTKPSKRIPLMPKVFADVQVGETVFTIGNSLGLLPDTISQGIVSGKRKIDSTPYIQITAAVSQGNSGGPVLDDRGKVIGLVSFYLTKGQSINMAAAVNEPLRVWDIKAAWMNASAFLQANRSISAPAQSPKTEISLNPGPKPIPEPFKITTGQNPKLKPSLLLSSQEDKNYLSQLAVSTDGSFAAASAKNNLYLFNVEEKKVELKQFESDIVGLAFKSSSDLLISCSDGSIEIRSCPKWSVQQRFQAKEAISRIRLSDDGKVLYYVAGRQKSGSRLVDWILCSIDLDEKTTSLVKSDFGNGLGDYEVAMDGSIVGVCDGFDGTNLRTKLVLLDRGGSERKTFKDAVSFVDLGNDKSMSFSLNSPVFSPDGQTVAVATSRTGIGSSGVSAGIETYNCETGLLKRTFDFPKAFVSEIAFFGDKQYLMVNRTESNQKFECLNLFSGDIEFKIEPVELSLGHIACAKSAKIVLVSVAKTAHLFRID